MKESNGKNSVEKLDQKQDLGLYFLELCRRKVKEELEDYDGDDEKEESPTELNTLNSSGGFVAVATDKLSVKYVSVNLHGHDVGVIQANKVAPMKVLVYYFEITVKDAGVKGQVSIGFTSENFKMRRQPGWEANSCGYHGDDGLLYRGQGKGETFGPTYTTGDIVGAGINYATQEFFFTKNGRVVGTVCKDMKGPLFPTVAVHSQNEEVQVNFGQKPFTFDLKEFEAQERMKQLVKIEDIPVVPNASYGIVRSYLLHYGYEDTLKSFDLASKSTVPPINIVQDNGIDDQETTYELIQRKTLRQLIRNGKIDAAFCKLREWYPQIAKDNESAMCFLLHCQMLIELVRAGALQEAVKYGRIELFRYFGSPVFEDLVQECVALLAYEKPSESVVGYLLKPSQREIVADTVNAMILSTNPNMKEAKNCLHSHLERLLKQLTACSLERRSLSGNQGETFQLQRVLSIGKRS
ncbi:unnamed protein product [Lathyrus sativus]|nr:unnamed protein product [Lathyrus sativus]